MYIGPRASDDTIKWMIPAFAKFPDFQKFLLENEGTAAGMGLYLEHLGGAAKKAVSRLKTQKDLEEFISEAGKFHGHTD